MKNSVTEINTLRGELKSTLLIVDKLAQRYREFLDDEFNTLGRRRITAVYLAEIMEDTYTCTETLFLRISQFFENSISQDRWHQDLLEKMRLEIPDIRKAVIAEQTFILLQEILRFRHFKRYYFELEYDWNKLDFLQNTYEKMMPLLKKDIDQFGAFLQALLD